MSGFEMLLLVLCWLAVGMQDKPATIQAPLGFKTKEKSDGDLG